MATRLQIRVEFRLLFRDLVPLFLQRSVVKCLHIGRDIHHGLAFRNHTMAKEGEAESLLFLWSPFEYRVDCFPIGIELVAHFL